MVFLLLCLDKWSKDGKTLETVYTVVHPHWIGVAHEEYKEIQNVLGSTD